MKVSCQRCGGIHQRGESCPEKALKGKVKYTEARKFRSRASWRKKAKTIKDRDQHLCRVCLLKGIIETKNLEVHHIIPLHEDIEKGLEDDYLITLCPHDHKLADAGKIERKKLLELAKEKPDISGFDFNSLTKGV